MLPENLFPGSFYCLSNLCLYLHNIMLTINHGFMDLSWWYYQSMWIFSIGVDGTKLPMDSEYGIKKKVLVRQASNCKVFGLPYKILFLQTSWNYMKIYGLIVLCFDLVMISVFVLLCKTFINIHQSYFIGPGAIVPWPTNHSLIVFDSVRKCLFVSTHCPLRNMNEILNK